MGRRDGLVVANRSGLFRTDDGGASWTEVTPPALRVERGASHVEALSRVLEQPTRSMSRLTEGPPGSGPAGLLDVASAGLGSSRVSGYRRRAPCHTASAWSMPCAPREASPGHRARRRRRGTSRPSTCSARPMTVAAGRRLRGPDHRERKGPRGLRCVVRSGPAYHDLTRCVGAGRRAPSRSGAGSGARDEDMRPSRATNTVRPEVLAAGEERIRAGRASSVGSWVGQAVEEKARREEQALLLSDPLRTAR